LNYGVSLYLHLDPLPPEPLPNCIYSIIYSFTELNARLKACSSPITIVCFLMLPAPYHSLAVDALKGQAATKKLQEGVKEITERVAKRMFEKAARFNG